MQTVLEVKSQDAKAEEDQEAAERHREHIERIQPEHRKRSEVFVHAARKELGVDVVRVPEEAEG